MAFKEEGSHGGRFVGSRTARTSAGEQRAGRGQNPSRGPRAPASLWQSEPGEWCCSYARRRAARRKIQRRSWGPRRRRGTLQEWCRATCGRCSNLQDAHPAPTARSSHGVRDEQRHHTGDPGHRRGKSPVHHLRDEAGQHARQSAGENGTQPLGRDRAPSNVVRSRSAQRSTQLSPPPTPAEALARAQLLLDFPPVAEKLDEWRATIRSLVAVANKDDLRPAGPSGRRSTEPPHAGAGRTEEAAAMVHSPLPRQPPRASARRDDTCDNISIASSDPRTLHDQRQVLR